MIQTVVRGRNLATLLALNTLVCSAAFWILERRWGAGYSMLDSLYWGVITAPTVGYGDILPTLAATKLLTMWLILSSVVGFGIGVALLTSWLIEDPFEKEVLDDTDDAILLLCGLYEHHGLPIPDSIEEYRHQRGTP